MEPKYGYFCDHCERVFSCYEISFIVRTLGHASETHWIIDEAVCISYSLTWCTTGPMRRSQLLYLLPLDVSHPPLGHPQVHLVSLAAEVANAAVNCPGAHYTEAGVCNISFHLTWIKSLEGFIKFSWNLKSKFSHPGLTVLSFLYRKEVGLWNPYVVCECVSSFTFEASDILFKKFSMKIMPLEASPIWNLLMSYSE